MSIWIEFCLLIMAVRDVARSATCVKVLVADMSSGITPSGEFSQVY